MLILFLSPTFSQFNKSLFSPSPSSDLSILGPLQSPFPIWVLFFSSNFCKKKLAQFEPLPISIENSLNLREKMARRASSPASPVTITISPQSNGGATGSSNLSGKVSGVAPFRSIGLTSPAPRRSLPGNPNSPIAARPIAARYSSSPKDETEEAASQSLHYTVHIPPTPDRQPVSVSSSLSEPKQNFISGTIFTGGFNSVTRGHVVETMDGGSDVRKSTGMFCRMNGCDEEALVSKMPCECGFSICKDCYNECQQGSGQCPGCKEPYGGEDEEESDSDDEGEEEEKGMPLTSVVEFRTARRRSLVKSTVKNQQGADFDHNRWLFETKGTYGYGNALWPKDGNGRAGGGGGFQGFDEPPNFVETSKRPLTRKVGVSQAILSPYR